MRRLGVLSSSSRAPMRERLRSAAPPPRGAPAPRATARLAPAASPGRRAQTRSCSLLKHNGASALLKPACLHGAAGRTVPGGRQAELGEHGRGDLQVHRLRFVARRHAVPRPRAAAWRRVRQVHAAAPVRLVARVHAPRLQVSCVKEALEGSEGAPESSVRTLAALPVDGLHGAALVQLRLQVRQRLCARGCARQ